LKFIILYILPLGLFLFATYQLYQSWKSFKNLKNGDTISNELSDQGRKMVKLATILIVLGSILTLIRIFIG
jgi:hypothetical protein